jgi:hypothetical protein
MTISDKFKHTVAAALLAGVGAVAGFGLAAGTANAEGAGEGEGAIDAWSNFEWCPGDPVMQSDAPVTWDWNTCHFWHYQDARENPPSLYHVVEGLRPNPCPPIAFMCP